MPPLFVIQGLFFLFFSFFLSVHSENTTASAPVCPVPLSPFLQHLTTGTPQHPTCSLSSRPADLPPPEFLSFEEWKVKQLAERDASNRDKENQPATLVQPASTQDVNSSKEIVRKSKRRNATEQLGENASPSSNEPSARELLAASSSPRSHIPLIDRFNYASNECNARIHSSHKGAKSASSILSRKKDRYMLSPCQTSGKERQFVIVELCEDIRIDTIQLANFEFFSGVFKDFRVSVAHAYTSDGKGWVVVGDYTAKNIRGVQSFHPRKELLPFYRYIRIDFLSYYGTEYFCPVSLLRVYGLTQMEEWKSDVWKAEWEASQQTTIPAAEQIPSPEPSVILLEGRPTSSIPRESAAVVDTTESWSEVIANDTPKTGLETKGSSRKDAGVSGTVLVSSGEPEVSINGVTSTSFDGIHETSREVAPVTTTTEPVQNQSNRSEEPTTESNANEGAPPAEVRSPQSTEADSSTTTNSDSRARITSLKASVLTATTATSASSSIPILHSANIVGADATQQTVTQTVSTTIILSAATPSPSVPAPNGESIYRMIINRLTTLEGNQTLYARYVEEQGRMVNVRLERMEEDIGRLGGIVTLQQQNVARMLEIHRAEMESKHGKLVSQVENLAHEVLMEKRLGVAQLVLLVTVLVFMGLTRGSRGEPIRLSRASAAWHKGIRSSGEWVSGWRGTRFSGADDETAGELRKSNSSPILQLRPAFAPRSTGTRLDSMESRPRRTSSQRARVHGAPYDEFFQSPPHLSRNPTRSRSRHNSQHSRSRNHTPTRPPLHLPGPIDPSRNYGALDLSTVQSEAPSGSSAAENTATYEKFHKRNESGGTGGYWRTGRSVSLSGVKGVGAGTSFGKSAGPTKRLAKTAHMHEVKPLRSASGPGPDASGDREGRSMTMPNELDASLSLSVLSPMMEDPNSAGLFGFGDARPRNVGAAPVRIGGFDAELNTAQSEGVLSDVFGSGPATSSSGLNASSGQNSGLGIPFPSPAMDADIDAEAEDVWVDESGEGEEYLDERASAALGIGTGPSSSPTRVKRGSGFAFGSPRRPFVFASSPPGKTRIKRRSDTSVSAAWSEVSRGEGV